ncbi:DNA-3-methyladenine glycosylase [Pedobacter gandavensis]|uniref:Putative 3-methyladenine DNA glycosylase n=1 Tax=Pedobacter gandavensis TaxID=2679963 RepID=A0ABR6ESZ0_9SPHI|nr:DNA-3-methyladenine glycosylase [Pedobacter gandavensis]MBB2148383.1 DNA-3-methyladenine glycosylase [Pedobacter gandavensis]
MAKLPFSFYQRDDVNALAISLLGKQLFTFVDGKLTAGIIVETEAYKGVDDKASHAYGGRFTDRTKVMYEPGGLSYVYLCYGIHHLFNVVTAQKGTPHAVLVRGLEPVIGIDVMLERRGMEQLKPNLTAGPGALAKAMGIDRRLNGLSLDGAEIWIEDAPEDWLPGTVVASHRVGVAYADDYAFLPWRYYLKGNKYVSKPRT